MFNTRLISNDGLKRRPGGFEIDIRLPWYRSLPLSVVEVGEVKIDGKVIPPSAISFKLNDKTIAPDALVNLTSEWWYVLDSAFLDVADVELSPDSRHEVSVVLALYPPYIPGFRRMTQCVKQLTAH